MERIQTLGIHLTIINDAYNASPEALKAAIKSLGILGKQNPKQRTVAFIGDMLELGDRSQEYHL